MLMIMKLPIAHRPIIESAGYTQVSLLIQSGCGRPTAPRIALSHPVSVLRNPSQTSVEATSGIMTGMYTRARRGPLNASLGWLSSTANPRLATIVTGIAISANLNVAMNDCAIVGSLPIRR